VTRQEVQAWVAAAVADGWTVRPAFKTESIERAAALEKDGWEARTLSRPPKKHGSIQASIHVWGPDKLAIRVSPPYSWEKLVSGLRACDNCKATDVETTRYYFAGRVCLECREVLKEEPGWTK